MSKTRDSSGGPRAVIHKRILEVARDNPDASLADIADEVSGANADLVDRVLTEYGDPGGPAAQDGSETQDDGTGTPQTDSTADGQSPDATDDGDRVTDPTVLSEKQLQTLHAVYEQPDADQGAIADRLGVTRATVSRRLNDIPGFEWSEREAFTADLLDGTEYESERAATDDTADPASAGESPTDDQSTAGAEAADSGDSSDSDDGGAALAGLEDRVATLEATLAEDTTAAERPLDRELAQRVVHAAMESERISEDEELELIDALFD